MTTTDMSSRKPTPFEMSLLMLWHGAISGAFLVAYLSGEGAYSIHLFSGSCVLGLVLLRLLMAALAPKDSPLFLKLPSLSSLFSGKGRNPLHAWVGVAIIIVLGIAAFSGLMADAVRSFDDFHEGLTALTPALVALHLGLVALTHGLKAARANMNKA